MRFIGLTVLGLAFVACSPVESEALQPETMPVESDGSIGDGISRPMLQTLTNEEFSGPIEMGMGCSFITEHDPSPLFVATAEDSAEAKGRAAVKINDTIVVLSHNGFGIAAVEAGGVYRSEAVEVTIEHSGGEPSSENLETYFWPAVLKISQDEGGSNSYEGIYECGA